MALILNMTLKAKLYVVITVLGLLSGISTAISFFLLEASDNAQVALDRASQGTIHLEHINGLVYAVVMESRGIYMSADAKQAEPFARNMTKQLAELQQRAAAWKSAPIESERARINALSANIEEFVRFRTELIRLGREVSTAVARTFGDNDANRTVRSGLNKQLDELAQAYGQLTERAYRQIETNKQISLACQFGFAVSAAAALVLGL